MTDRIDVFVGPSCTQREVNAILPEARVHPPVRHGDLLRLDLRSGDVVVIIDGVFHHSAPVRHKEILYALSRGTAVVGAASMGALRAAELQAFGMIGVGVVFEQYRDGILDADDEVAVAHGDADTGYQSYSHPLVNIRWLLARAAEDGVLTSDEADRLVVTAKALPYPHRTWNDISARAAATSPELLDPLKSTMTWLSRRDHESVDLKRRDATAALRRVRSGVGLPDATGWVSSPGWHSRFLQRWRVEHRIIACDDASGLADPSLPDSTSGRVTPSESEVLSYQQLYDPGFPERWRAFVVDRMCATEPEQAIPLRLRAAAVTAGFDGIPPSVAEYWLTPDERVLPEHEQLARVVVRAERNRPGVLPVVELKDGENLIDWSTNPAEQVVAAQRFNRAVADSGARRTVGYLRSDLIGEDLANAWGIDVGEHARFTAAARDRGFADMSDAIRAARPFFLLRAHQRRTRGRDAGTH